VLLVFVVGAALVFVFHSRLTNDLRLAPLYLVRLL